MNDYRVELLSRETGARLNLILQLTPLGYHWETEEGQELENLPPQPTIIRARRALEKLYLWTHEIYWPVIQPKKPGHELCDTAIRIQLPRTMLHEYRLLAGMMGKPMGTLMRLILQHYLRPGTLPTFDAAFVDHILAERDRKHKKP